MPRPQQIGATVALLVLITLLLPQRMAAQDCDFDNDEMDDIQRIRRCMEVSSSADWTSPGGYTMLHRAARRSSNPAVLAVILDAGFDPNAMSDQGLTPLHEAAFNDNGHRVIPVLIDAGARPGVRSGGGWAPLHYAVNNGYRVSASILLDAGADPNAKIYSEYLALTPLQLAAGQDDPILVSTLLDKGADPVARDVDGQQPIHFAACSTDSRTVVSTLLRGGAGSGLTSLHMAVLMGDRSALTTALGEGADPNAADDFGWTPLHLAGMAGRFISEPILVPELIAAGANPEARDLSHGRTPLTSATRCHGGIAVVEAFLAAGAEPGTNDNYGSTPLHYAVSTEDKAVIAALVGAGANPDAADLDGDKPIDYLLTYDKSVSQISVISRLLSLAAEPEPGWIFRDCSACPEMVVVPAGSFMMGAPSSEEGRWFETQHRVTIESAFAVGMYEVTFAEWDACVTAGACGGHRPDDEGWGRGSRPVINVSWEDAHAYLEWLSEETGERYQLLSEAEWEYVARAGTQTARYWGESESEQCEYGNGADIAALAALAFPDWTPVSCVDGYVHTAPVGSFQPNAFGLYDVLGNVFEWTEDCWELGYSGAPDNGSPWKSGDCSRRVLRGGSWDNEPKILRSGFRGPDEDRSDKYGFRVARTIN